MTYALEADVRTAFGSANIDRWADLDNNGDVPTITARIAWALDSADVEP